MCFYLVFSSKVILAVLAVRWVIDWFPITKASGSGLTIIKSVALASRLVRMSCRWHRAVLRYTQRTTALGELSNLRVSVSMTRVLYMTRLILLHHILYCVFRTLFSA
jgi:hypothetical protein